jgi:ABC-type Fe3+ transport system permease subunit
MLQVRPDISEQARSAGLTPDSVKLAITLPTFRRPDHLDRDAEFA